MPEVFDYATHKHEKVRKWLKRNKRVRLDFIPTSSSWLNLVERFVGLLTEKQFRRGIFASVKKFEEIIMKFINSHDKKNNFLVWTKSAEEILVKVE